MQRCVERVAELAADGTIFGPSIALAHSVSTILEHSGARHYHITSAQAVGIASVALAAPTVHHAVEMLVRLFDVISDRQNFATALRSCLPLPAIHAVHCRLGPLNCIDPHRLDGRYMLDLQAFDQHKSAAFFVKLAKLKGDFECFKHVTLTTHGHTLEFDLELMAAPAVVVGRKDSKNPDKPPPKQEAKKDAPKVELPTAGLLCFEYVSDPEDLEAEFRLYHSGASKLFLYGAPQLRASPP